MFKNRSFNVKMVKDAVETPATIVASLDFDKIDKIIKEYALAAAIGSVLIYAAVKTIDTASIVTVNYTNPINR